MARKPKAGAGEPARPEAVVATPPPALEALARDVYALLVRDMGDAKAKALWRFIAAKPGRHRGSTNPARNAKIVQVIEVVGKKRPNERHKIIPEFADFLTEIEFGKRSIRNATQYDARVKAEEKSIRRFMNERKAELAARNKALAAALLAPDRPKLGGLYDLGAAALAEKKDKIPP